MKKLLYLLTVVVAITVSSCTKILPDSYSQMEVKAMLAACQASNLLDSVEVDDGYVRQKLPLITVEVEGAYVTAYYPYISNGGDVRYYKVKNPNE